MKGIFVNILQQFCWHQLAIPKFSLSADEWLSRFTICNRYAEKSSCPIALKMYKAFPTQLSPRIKDIILVWVKGDRTTYIVRSESLCQTHTKMSMAPGPVVLPNDESNAYDSCLGPPTSSQKGQKQKWEDKKLSTLCKCVLLPDVWF